MAEVVNLVGILDDLKSLLETANATTTSTPVYLSNNLTHKVKYIGTVHPTFIPLQTTFYPFVTCYVSSKRPQNASIGVNQLQAKRKAEINVEVVGATHNSTTPDFKKDKSATDCMYLMENIELALRNIPSINGKVSWQSVSDVIYYEAPANNGYLRAGILSLKGVVFY